MTILENDNTIILKDIECFNLTQTLECGQCFRYTKLQDNKYILVAKNKVLEIEQTEDAIIFSNTSLQEFNTIWYDYFDLSTDYQSIIDYLIANDTTMSEVIQSSSGIRLLNQDFVETLISFIISQNKQIPQIKQVVEQLCTKYGTFLQQCHGVDYYAFPTIDKLKTITEQEFKECKAGFRAKYLVDACEKLSNGSIKESDFRNLSATEIRNQLCTIKGVGIKVSNCVLLYGLRQKDSFPIDVWIKRIMERLYFSQETKLEDIQTFAKEKFGEYGGYAQQYLFYYARSIS